MREFCRLFLKIVKNAFIQCNKWRKMHCDSAKYKNLHLFNIHEHIISVF